MTDKDKLIAACVRTPEDDLPRLALADWLRENGEQDAGDFIQWQVEHPDCSASCESDWNTGQICDKEMGECPICRNMNTLNVSYVFLGAEAYVARRGFLDEVSCTALTWEHWGPELVKVTPVRRVKLRDISLAPMEVTGGNPVWVIGTPLPKWFFKGLSSLYYFQQDFPFKTRELGEEYITQICLGYARSRAGTGLTV